MESVEASSDPWALEEQNLDYSQMGCLEGGQGGAGPAGILGGPQVDLVCFWEASPGSFADF